ncbi:MAG: 2-oxoglutarate dehydrogenase E1 component, partial [Chthoniobacterales bacterium]
MKSSFTSRWNQALLDENYERWSVNPQAVDAAWAAFFEGFELGFAKSGKNGVTANGQAGAVTDGAFQTKVDALINGYRALGHTKASVDPLSDTQPENPLLGLEALGFSESDLERKVSSTLFKDGQALTLKELIAALEHIYCRTIGVEFMHILNPETRNWVLS